MARRSAPGGDTLLQQALERDVMRRAWDEVADNEGVPGVDNVSIAAWRRNWEERLAALAQAVRTNTYKPQKLRAHYIPKRTPGEYRLLRIPTVTDRVLQRAVAEVLQPFYEHVFHDCSYGYRPGRGLKQAVQQILVQRANERVWVLDADIDACFDSIDHELLRRFLGADLPDISLLPLISVWMAQAGAQSATQRGLAMGSPLSPLLANVYLHRLDTVLLQRGLHVVRYADDFIVLEDSYRGSQLAYEWVETALAELRLRYEPAKTRLTCFAKGFTFVGVEFLGDSYSYTWEGQEMRVFGDRVDTLFGQCGPEYR